MIFLDSLPETVTVSGKEYPIYTDFRDWIRFDGLMRDQTISDRQRAAVMLDWYKDELPPPASPVYEALFGFYLCGSCSQKTDGKQTKEVFSLEQDLQMVYAGFIQSYQINILSIDYLHWWEFRALLDGLPEDTKLSKVMGYRAVDLSKVPKSERSRYQELKRLFALKQPGTSVATTLEDRDRELLRYAQQARERVEKIQHSTEGRGSDGL